MQRVLAAIGCFEHSRLNEVADGIYSQGIFEDTKQMLRVRLIAVAAEESEELLEEFPGVVQLPWVNILGFIGSRLFDYRSAKSDSHQWDAEIKLLKALVANHNSRGDFQKDHFISDCLRRLGIRS